MDITQLEMAEKLGIDRNTYRSIENGSTKILNAHISQISEILQTSIEELVFGYKPAKEENSSQLEDYKALSDKQMENLKRSYEKQLQEMKERLDKSEEIINILKQQIRDKEEIIALLKSHKN